MASTQVTVILESLLSGLIHPTESQLGLMKSDIVNSEMIPAEMKLHKAIFEGIERCDEKGMPPTVENVTLLSMAQVDIVDEVRRISEIPGTHGMVHANAIWFKGWAEQQLLGKAAKEIAKINSMDYANVVEKQGMMLDALMNLPIEHTKQSYTRLEIIELLETEQKKRVERRKKGQALGGILPLAKLRELSPVLESGDVTLITAPPKAGKTTVGMIIAEMNAIENDCDVLWLLLETSPKTIEERFIARDIKIPGRMLRKGLVDLTEEPFRTPHQDYKARQVAYWHSKGRIHLEYVAGEKMSRIAAMIRMYKRMSDQRGRPLIVIIDYLQRFPKAANKAETEAIAGISNYIKDLAVKYDCHIILFSQESFSIEGKGKGDSRAHGSNTPIFIAQLHLGMRVLNSTSTVMVGDGKGGIARDLCNNERHWQVEGRNKRQAVVRFDLLRANDGEAGEAFAAFEGGLFSMTDLSEEGISVPQFMKDEMDLFSEDMKVSSRQLI